jgi:hypothetical protein
MMAPPPVLTRRRVWTAYAVAVTVDVLQLALGSVLGGSLWALSPWLAGRVLLDPLLAPLIAASALVVFSYAPYAALIGALNGRQRFAQQATLDMTFTSMRTLFMLGAAALGFGALGVLLGFGSAAFGVLLLALLMVGKGERGQQIPWKRWLAFMAPLWLYQLCLNLTLQVDLSVLKGSIAALGRDGGMLAAAAADTASRSTRATAEAAASSSASTRWSGSRLTSST